MRLPSAPSHPSPCRYQGTKAWKVPRLITKNSCPTSPLWATTEPCGGPKMSQMEKCECECVCIAHTIGCGTPLRKGLRTC